jgi:ABC-type nitrate/sulfonate/bicarbonate transport system substrate-binding protein
MRPLPGSRPTLRAIRSAAALAAALAAGLLATPTSAQEAKFADLVGDVAVKPVQKQDVLQVPFITWGGDAATFQANGGGLKTAKGSTFDTLGLDVNLTPGDDFVGQVKDYLSGESPFLRGTFRMLGQASGVIGADPRTKPVVILQLSWSAGDHVVGRANVKTVNDLKGKKIAVQQGGPHVGLLYDVLKSAELSRDDVELVFVEDLSGPGGAAELFRNDESVAACCVITPDMIGLTGGPDSAGTGAEGTVKGARVVVSTAELSRSVADVYAVRKDYFDSHRTQCENFAAGWLAGREQVVAMRNEFESGDGRMSGAYRKLLESAQTIFNDAAGENVMPNLEVDLHGLLLDCRFADLPGQIEFFRTAGNLVGFDAKLSDALDLATAWGYADVRNGFEPAPFDYRSVAKIAGLDYKEPERRERVASPEGDIFGSDAELDENTILEFTISFDPNQSEFSADRYGAEFRRAVENAARYAGAVVVIRGHSDPTATLREMILGGMSKGTLRRTGSSGNYKYYHNGRPFDPTDFQAVETLIGEGAFDAPPKHRPRAVMQKALNLSVARAAAVKKAIADYAEQAGVRVDLSALTPTGAGISDPVIPKPRSLAEAKENMRVEFPIVRVDAEVLGPDEFDF